MKSAFLLLILLCPGLTGLIHAQSVCGFDTLHKRELATNPGFARTISANSQYLRQYIDSHPETRTPRSARGAALYTIPVVVHVMHTGGAVGTIYNPDDAQIIEAIEYLNDVYAGTYPGMAPAAPGGAAGDMEIRFALAQRTPSCGATNGINRVDASVLTNYVARGINANNTNGVPELTLKNLARWNPSEYYNIWVVNRIDGADGTAGQFIAGFAWFPGASSLLDGTVMLATQMREGEKTLPHEIGHALNLHHPFYPSANSSQCPPAGPCATTGDEVCDTDPIFNNVTGGVYNFSCRSGNNTCTSGPVRPYSANTESNFMSYTSCYTLFTNDQKARVQAAMTLPSRASLVAAGNMALVPCGTFINFTQASASRTEDVTGTLLDCRRYRDYNYQMVIGTGPSAAATAMLSFSGTATRGLDYEVSTNGDFSSPSHTLNFAASSTSAQSFTVRVYDDGAVEAAETIIIDFTVNNGGGNAQKGITTPTLTLTIADNDLAPAATGTGVYAPGTITSYVEAPVFDARQQNQRSQFVYRASELTAAGMSAGTINALELYVYLKQSTRPFTNLSIRMAHTTVANLYDNPTLVAVGGLTTVYTTASYATAQGWNLFTLSTPFVWNGTSNIAVDVCYDNGTADGANMADGVGSYSDGGSATQGNLIFQNGINCSGAFSTVSLYSGGLKPLIRFSVAAPGTPVETVAGSSSGWHIDGPSNDYFYSNNNRLMMRVSGSSALLGCVNAVVEEAGSSWINYQGGQRSAKVFAVTPTLNGTGTSYTASFYFTNAELGGKTASTLKIAKTTAASAATANSSNTVLVTPVVTAFGPSATIFTASFNGFSRFFLVDAGVTLPVSFADFYGETNAEKNNVLTWLTASEFDNHHFELELSRDGVQFVSLANIPSRGNSMSMQQYSYVHVRPQAGTNWYRVKQVDRDGRSSYSKTIALQNEALLTRAFAYPVPARDRVTIQFGAALRGVELELFSADMKSLRREKASGLLLKHEMDISGLAPGVYFVRFVCEGKAEMVRFVKEH